MKKYTTPFELCIMHLKFAVAYRNFTLAFYEKARQYAEEDNDSSAEWADTLYREWMEKYASSLKTAAYYRREAVKHGQLKRFN